MADVERTLTFGEKAVGLTFNPSNDENVAQAKQLMAEVIDLVVDSGKGFNQLAIDQLMLAQMAAVKSLTWKE